MTSRALIPPNQWARGAIVAHEAGVVAGLPVVARLFRLLDSRVRIISGLKDGQPFRAGQTLARLEGPARVILAGERVALNFLSHLSGIATLTAAFKRRLARHPRVRLLDTRKTTPGLRALEKYAVRIGGGTNHRFGLYDQVLIKDNHWAILRKKGQALFEHEKGPGPFLRRLRRRGVPIIIEAKTLGEFRLALKIAPDVILLDNMSPQLLRRCVVLRNRQGPKPLLEASGGVTLRNIRRIAATGVDRISVGALTQAAPPVDFSLEM